MIKSRCLRSLEGADPVVLEAPAVPADPLREGHLLMADKTQTQAVPPVADLLPVDLAAVAPVVLVDILRPNR